MGDYQGNIFFRRENGGYIADTPDLKCCSAFGSSREEALGEVNVARVAWLETASESGRPIPEPKYAR